MLLINLNAEKNCCNFSKIWQLCMHSDYDHFVPLTFKSGIFQAQTNIFPGNSNPCSIKACCCVG